VDALGVEREPFNDFLIALKEFLNMPSLALDPALPLARLARLGRLPEELRLARLARALSLLARLLRELPLLLMPPASSSCPMTPPKEGPLPPELRLLAAPALLMLPRRWRACGFVPLLQAQMQARILAKAKKHPRRRPGMRAIRASFPPSRKDGSFSIFTVSSSVSSSSSSLFCSGKAMSIMSSKISVPASPMSVSSLQSWELRKVMNSVA